MQVRKPLAPFVLALLPLSFAHAEPTLIAIGQIDGNYEDFAVETKAPLENGVPGNKLGGIGSGLAYAGSNTFLALPDRGPNATPYNSAVDDTTSYIPRFHTLHLSLARNPGGASLPFTLTPFVTDTTLLSSTTPLVYGSGQGLGVGNGAPSLNTRRTNYFSGRSDNFDPDAAVVESEQRPFRSRVDSRVERRQYRLHQRRIRSVRLPVRSQQRQPHPRLPIAR